MSHNRIKRTMRLGIDVGGTKIEIVALGPGGAELLRQRVPTPRQAYEDVVRAIRDLVAHTEATLGARGTVGIALPGAISAKTGLVKNANSTVLIGHPMDKDLAAALGREVRVQNDANCFALSEASDGAGAGFDVVFGIIAGTGIGGGLCVGGRVLTGAHSIAGEWGHNPLPSPHLAEELSDPRLCYCGRVNCIETWCSGPALAAQYAKRTGRALDGTGIAEAAGQGDLEAAAVLDAFLDRFARAIATLVDIVDPDAIVMGGGLSNIGAFYSQLPGRIEKYCFTPESPPRVLKNLHGDSSGVRGAAWLWREYEAGGLPK